MFPRHRSPFLPILIFALCCISAVCVFAFQHPTIQGRVVGVLDGDTLVILTPEKRQARVRLAEIDAPESKQPYGSQAKRELADLTFGHEVVVHVHDVDRYERVVGSVYCGHRNVNHELVKRGAAWVYPRYAKDPTLYQLQEEARKNKRGLWALPEDQIFLPWEWRTLHKNRG